MKNTAVVTGAGSGVGRAIAVALGRKGWKVALVGRRDELLRETAALAVAAGAADAPVYSCDIGDVESISEMASSVLERFGGIEALVNAAGTNIPQRSLELLSLDAYHQMIDTNLHGAYYCLQAFLPTMRRAESGTIVNIISDAGKQASPKSGPSYVMAKFGITGLTQSINAEERAHGIRACAIFPGDIDTPLLDKRPSPPTSEARQRMLRAEDVAECALLAIELPSRAIVEEILIRPR